VAQVRLDIPRKRFVLKCFTYTGVWITPPSSDGGPMLPSTTVIGSSNYGARSEKFDLECSFLMTTDALSLRKLLAQQVSNMRENARQIMDSDAFSSKERKVDVITRLLTRLMKGML